MQRNADKYKLVLQTNTETRQVFLDKMHGILEKHGLKLKENKDAQLHTDNFMGTIHMNLDVNKLVDQVKIMVVEIVASLEENRYNSGSWDKLLEQVEKINRKHDILSTNYSILQTEHDKLKSEMKEKNNNLKVTYNELKLEYNKLKKKYSELKEKCSELKREIQRVETS